MTCASRFWPGALLDRIVHTHVAHLEVKAMAEEWGVSVYDVLNAVVDCLVANVPATEGALRTRCRGWVRILQGSLADRRL